MVTFITVVGCQYHAGKNINKLGASFTKENITFKVEPNIHAPNGEAVMVFVNTSQLGYLPNDECQTIAQILNDGRTLKVLEFVDATWVDLDTLKWVKVKVSIE